MGRWVGGQFDPGQFDPKQFDTGIFIDDTAKETMAPPDYSVARKFAFYEQVKREDEEIFAIILCAVKSGILDE